MEYGGWKSEMGWKELRTRVPCYFCLQAEARPLFYPDLQVEPHFLPLSFDYSCIIMTMPSEDAVA